MKSKLLYLHVQAFLVDENDAGEVVNAKVPCDPVELTLGQLPAYLRSIPDLCARRATELTAQNRAARRRTAKGGKK